MSRYDWTRTLLSCDIIINVTLSDLKQAQNWHDAHHKMGHGGPDLASGPPVCYPCTSISESTIERTSHRLPKRRWRPCYISSTQMVRFLDKVQWTFSRTLRKSEAIVTGVSHDVGCWARFQPSTAHPGADTGGLQGIHPPTRQSSGKPSLHLIQKMPAPTLMECSERFPELWWKWSYHHWSFPWRIFLGKVSAKYCIRVINIAIAMTWIRPGKRHAACNWATCELLWKSFADEHKP